MALYEIIYTSLATHDVPPSELADLLARARANNEALGVTGMMVYRKREFMQLLEGEAEAVRTLYDKISSDPRHQQISKLWDGPITERSFSSWDMAFVAPDDLAMEGRPGFQGMLSQGLKASPGDSTGKRLLLSLRDDLLLG